MLKETYKLKILTYWLRVLSKAKINLKT
jgi:hypothetical protein